MVWIQSGVEVDIQQPVTDCLLLGRRHLAPARLSSLFLLVDAEVARSEVLSKNVTKYVLIKNNSIISTLS